MGRMIEILLVEDEEADVSLIKGSFEKFKFANHLHVCRDGQEALEFLNESAEKSRKSIPDLILLDLNMPRMDGKKFLREVKKEEALKKIPVAVMTSSDAETDVVKGYELGANCYIRKPVNLLEIHKVVAAIEFFWFRIATLPPK